jgi:hypothetical protein
VDHLNTEQNPEAVVGLFVGFIPRKWHSRDTEDKPYLSASNASWYYLNPNITEALPFYERSLIYSTVTVLFTYFPALSTSHYRIHACIICYSSYCHRFKDQHIYIERPPPSETEEPIQAQETPLQQKPIAELNTIDPYEFAVKFISCIVT